MGQYGQVQVDDYIADITRRAADAHNIPQYLLMAIVMAESDFDQGATGDPADGPTVNVNGVSYQTYYDPRKGGYFCSIGLLQLNRCGGQGTGHDAGELLIGTRNLEVGTPPIAEAVLYAQGQGFTGDRFIREVARNSGHPGFVDLNDYRLDNIVTNVGLLVSDGAGHLVIWPPIGSGGTGQLPPPPPPLGAWTEQPTPRDEATAEQAIQAHFDRVNEIFRRF